MTGNELRAKYIEFFKNKGHIEIPAAPLVPENDPTTLFTSSGMQPLIPYLLGQTHPEGKRLVDSQPSFRAEDIDEVGDNRHTTFFEMLGNWYLDAQTNYKEQQLRWFFEFLTDKEEGLRLNPEKIYISVFDGDRKFNAFGEPDIESSNAWKKLFEEKGVDAKVANINSNEKPDIKNGRIFYYPAAKNWWSRSGIPEKMPIGEIGGPDSEVFFDFGETLNLHEKSKWKNEPCHPNCDCGRFLEIGNSVFIQYKKVDELTFEELPNKNVDFGGGLERLLAATYGDPDVFKTDLFWPLIKSLQTFSKFEYGSNKEIDETFRIIVDHVKTATFLIKAGVLPGNKLQGYILRRFIRRAAVKSKRYFNYDLNFLANLSSHVIAIYSESTNYFDIKNEDVIKIHDVIFQEVKKFELTLDKGLKEIDKRFAEIDINGWIDSPENAAKFAFDLYQTYGLPLDAYFDDLLKKHGIAYGWGQKEELYKEFEKLRLEHSNQSRTASAGMFKGGLQDRNEETTKLHTATHLLHQSLRIILGDHVSQKGSNITSERLRFDFSHPEKLTEEQIKLVEDLVNEQINKNLPITVETMDKSEALKLGALAFFAERYPEKVTVYSVGSFSKEICGGPHVNNTSELKHFKILKEESAGAGIRRIYASVG